MPEKAARSASPVVLFYVQHLLGIGHVFRATRIARELARAGAQVHVAWGGTQLPSINTDGLNMHFLPPVRVSDAGFQTLVDADGVAVDDAFRAHRRDMLLGLLQTLRPDIVMTEAYPFGRTHMCFELEPLMTAARAAPWQPMTVASIRDIMQENRADKRVAESVQAARQWFDLVLVHGDPALIRIEDTLQGAGEIAGMFAYTGIVTPDPVDLSVPPSISADVVVSAGGGAVGHALTAAAIGAPQHCQNFPENWLLVVGPERALADFEALKAAAPAQMQVVRFVPDLARIFASAQVSVSRAGYNTVGDLLRARCRAVLAPFEGGRETEQRRRAEMFARAGRAIMIRADELSPQALAAAVDRAMTMPPLAADLDLEGAANAARLLLSNWRKREHLNV